ncbi:MAG: TIGR02757 family protein [bacterium JZ-2024 1]
MRPSPKVCNLLNQAFTRYHTRGALSGDPWEFPARFRDPRDVECAAFIAAVISFGTKISISRTLNILADPLGKHPAEYARRIAGHRLNDFRLMRVKHRWLTGSHLIRIVAALGLLYLRDESLASFFYGTHIEIGLNHLATFFYDAGVPAHLVPAPARGSACKRPLLFLRWMVRDDGLDFGIWKNVLRPRDLVIPLDIHSYRVARALQLTRRKSVTWKTALEVTESLRTIDPDDPVRFDFALHNLSYQLPLSNADHPDFLPRHR